MWTGPIPVTPIRRPGHDVVLAGVLAAPQCRPRTARSRCRIFRSRPTGPGEALLKVEANGLCGTDVEQFNGQLKRSGWSCYPQIPGHEAFGRLAWVGEEAARTWGLREGDRVSVESTVPCWVCSECRTGREKFCRRERFVYGYVPVTQGCGLWGGLSEYMVMRPAPSCTGSPTDSPQRWPRSIIRWRPALNGRCGWAGLGSEAGW